MISYEYIWLGPNNFSSNSESISNLIAGLYSLNVIDDNGCNAEMIDIEVTENEILQLDIDNTTNITCFGENDGIINVLVSGGTGSYSFSWSNGQTTQNIDNLPPNIYNVEVSDSNGCSVELNNIEILEPEELNIIVETSDYSGYGVSCYGESDGFINITINGGVGDINYNWSNGESTENLNNISAGIYSLTIIDDNNCSNSETVTITENSMITIINTTENCSNEGVVSVDVDGGSPNYTYNLIDVNDNIISSNNTGIFENAQEGEYNVLITDNDGCQNQINVDLNIAPIADFSINEFQFYLSNNPSIFTDLSIDSNIDSWNWNFGDGNSSNEQNPIYLYSSPGFYTVELIVTDEFGCNSTKIKNIEVLQDYFSYTPDTFTPNNDGVNDIFHPSLTNINIESYQLFIFDRWGKGVFSTINYNEGWDGTNKEGIELPSDVYNYKILYKTNLGVEKEEVGKILMLK